MCSWRQLDLPSCSEDDGGKPRTAVHTAERARPPPCSALGQRTVLGYPKRGEEGGSVPGNQSSSGWLAAGLANQAAPSGGST